MFDLRFIAMALSVLTTSATAEDLSFKAEVIEGSTPAMRINVTDKSDSADGGQASVSRDMGRCLVMIWVTADGYVRAAQVATSTGFLNLDDACLKTVLGQRTIVPRTTDGRPIDRWVTLSISWVAKGSLATKPAKAHLTGLT